jgi:N-acetylneuraminic acid mutarotase
VGGRTMNGASMSTVQAYNAATNVWNYRAPLPLPLYRSNGIGVIGGKLYHTGGQVSSQTPTRALFVYDPATNKWTRKRDMPFTGYDGVTAVISNKLYLVTSCSGGEDCDVGSAAQRLFRYDPATDTWITRAPPAHFHAAGAGGALGGKFYITGGGSRELEVYDPATNRWTTRAPAPSTRSFAGSTVLNNKLHIIGGSRVDPDGTRASAVHVNTVYDPATNTWVNKKSMPSARVHISANRVVVGGQARIEVVGGKRPGNNTQYIP